MDRRFEFANEDTVAAPATPPGQGALAVIRISGPEALAVADSIFKSRSGKLLQHMDGYTLHFGRIIRADGSWIDEVLAAVFRAPRSFTGEDSVELSCHGSPYIVQEIMRLLLDNGARSAQPGEFSRRAFLHGKLDLTQAEAVADMIHASCEAGLRGARNQLDGMLAERVNSLRDALLKSASLLELELDFVEEDLEFVPPAELEQQLLETVAGLDQLLGTWELGKARRDGVNVALAGPPNVGKSSLLNRFLRESRAIVSAQPGTTRDVIREELVYNGFLYRLYDTAGIRETVDAIEQEGVRRSRESVAGADLVLCIGEDERSLEAARSEAAGLTDPGRVITVLNKRDLYPEGEPLPRADIAVSAQTGAGLEQLFELLEKRALGSWIYSEQGAVITNLRHRRALLDGRDALQEAAAALQQGMSNEFVAVDLQRAADALGEIIGAVSDDDILHNIFDNFCIGK